MKKNNEEKGIFLYIPPIVLKDKNLSTTDRFLLGCMINLDKDEGCRANNSYLAKCLNCSRSSISKSIKHLEDLKYIIYNQPNKNRGGRGHIRHVRDDLKYKKPEESIKETTPLKTTHLPSKKTSHIYKRNEKDLKNEKISIKEENKLVQNELKIPVPDKWKFYKSCKDQYNEHHVIVWDKEQIEYLIELCNKLFQSFKDRIDLKREKLSNCLLEIFAIAIRYKPKFFTDSLPRTFVRFWNTVIQQPKFEEYVGRIYKGSIESHF